MGAAGPNLTQALKKGKYSQRRRESLTTLLPWAQSMVITRVVISKRDLDRC